MVWQLYDTTTWPLQTRAGHLRMNVTSHHPYTLYPSCHCCSLSTLLPLCLVNFCPFHLFFFHPPRKKKKMKYEIIFALLVFDWCVCCATCRINGPLSSPICLASRFDSSYQSLDSGGYNEWLFFHYQLIIFTDFFVCFCFKRQKIVQSPIWHLFFFWQMQTCFDLNR